MANPWVLSVTLQDENGVKRSTPVGFVTVDDTITLAQLKAAWKTWALTVDALSDGRSVAGNLSFTYGLAEITALGGFKSAAGDEEVVEGVVFDFNLEDNNKAFGAYIPAVKDAAYTGAKINLTYAAVTAFTGLMTDGIEDVGNFTDGKGLDLTSLRAAFQSTRKNRRALHARSLSLPAS